MIDGFYKIVFGSPTTSLPGAGVLILERNLARGGDGSFYYDGYYTVSNNEIVVNVSVIHHSGQVHNILGNLTRYDLELRANLSDMIFSGRDIHGHGVVIVLLEKIANVSRHEILESLID